VFHPDELRQNLESADDQDLEGARDEVRSLISVLKSFASITELIFGPHAFGLDIFRDLDTSEPLIQAFLLLVWLDLRTHPAFMEACKTLIAALPRPAEQTIGFEGLVQLGHEVPGLGDILNVRRLRTAIGNPELVKALNEELKERLQQHRVEVDAFMQRHPIFQQAINVLLGLEAR
jgi:hypothetical protein